MPRGHSIDLILYLGRGGAASTFIVTWVPSCCSLRELFLAFFLAMKIRKFLSTSRNQAGICAPSLWRLGEGARGPAHAVQSARVPASPPVGVAVALRAAPWQDGL
jgi:hypothetical protein